MDNRTAARRALATKLATVDDPALMLPDLLLYDPLDLLISLHEEVLNTMLSSLEHARRAAAAAAWLVEHYWPDVPILQAQAHWTQGTALLYVPNYAGALAHYDAALTCYERASAQYNNHPPRDIRVVQVVRVFCLSELGRYAEALQAVDHAEAWLRSNPNEAAHLTLLLNRSQLAGRMGDYALMVELSDLTIAQATELKQAGRLAQGWINRGHACIYLGRFADAELALEQGVTIAQQSDEPLTVARGLCNRARLLRCRGQLFEALTVLRMAQRGLAQAEGEAATVALEEASLYEQLHQLLEAERAANLAAQQFAQQDMPTYSARAALAAARIALRSHRASAARRHLEVAARQIRATGLAALEAELMVTEAALAILPHPTLSNKRTTALRRAARAAAAQAVTTLQSLGLVRDAASGELIIAALDAQTNQMHSARNTYERLAQIDDRHIQLTASAQLGGLLAPAEALPHLQRAAFLATEQRRALPMEELQARYSSETSPYHMYLAACWLALDDIEKALESVWAAKAGPLIDLRAAAGALDDAMLVMLEPARAELARWRAQEQEHRSKAQSFEQIGQPETAEYHQRQAAAAAAAVQVQEQRLTEMVRTLGDRSGQERVPAFAEVCLALQPGTVLLEYAQFEDELVCFLVRHGYPPQFRRLGRYNTIQNLRERWKIIYHRLRAERAAATTQEQLQAVMNPMWHMLLEPWRAELADCSQLLIAPSSVLHHLPWAAIFEQGARNSESGALTLTPCGALWGAQLPPSLAPPGPARLLGYSGDTVRPLPFVAAELGAVARTLPDAMVKTAATSADLRALPAPRLLHIATHGHTELAAPLCSTLELADGPFLLLEAHRLNLRGTELVVLSACETGVHPDSGDMALALAGAFLCAGARVVLASLWPVADTAAAALMEQFYAELAAGALADRALRRAQEHIRAQHPLDWMAFQLWAGASYATPGTALI